MAFPAESLKLRFAVCLESEANGVVEVVPTDTTVKLDEEMAAMAKNALQYQTLVGAYERMVGLMRLAIREGRE
jgi:flagellar basal body rod protein FlgB